MVTVMVVQILQVVKIIKVVSILVIVNVNSMFEKEKKVNGVKEIFIKKNELKESMNIVELNAENKNCDGSCVGSKKSNTCPVTNRSCK